MDTPSENERIPSPHAAPGHRLLEVGVAGPGVKIALLLEGPYAGGIAFIEAMLGGEGVTAPFAYMTREGIQGFLDGAGDRIPTDYWLLLTDMLMSPNLAAEPGR